MIAINLHSGILPKLSTYPLDIWITIKAPPKSSEGAFVMCTDTTTIQRVSIPRSLICSFTASMGTSSLWKIPAAKAASALVLSNISEKCSTLPAPLEAMTGMVPSQLTNFKIYSPYSCRKLGWGYEWKWGKIMLVDFGKIWKAVKSQGSSHGK